MFDDFEHWSSEVDMLKMILAELKRCQKNMQAAEVMFHSKGSCNTHRGASVHI